MLIGRVLPSRNFLACQGTLPELSPPDILHESAGQSYARILTTSEHPASDLFVIVDFCCRRLLSEMCETGSWKNSIKQSVRMSCFSMDCGLLLGALGPVQMFFAVLMPTDLQSVSVEKQESQLTEILLIGKRPFRQFCTAAH